MPQRRQGGGMTARLTHTPLSVLKQRGNGHTMFDDLHMLLIRVMTRSLSHASPLGIARLHTHLSWSMRVVLSEDETLELLYVIDLAHWRVSSQKDTRRYAFAFKISLTPPATGYSLDEFAHQNLCAADGTVLDYSSLRDRGKGYGDLNFFDTDWPAWVNHLWEDAYALQASEIETQLSSGQLAPDTLLAALNEATSGDDDDARNTFDATMRAPRQTPSFAATSTPSPHASVGPAAIPDDGFAHLIRERDHARETLRTDEALIVHAYEQGLTDAQDLTYLHYHPDEQLDQALRWAQKGFPFPEQWRGEKAHIVAELERLIAQAKERLEHYDPDKIRAEVAAQALTTVCGWRGHTPTTPSAPVATVCATCGATIPALTTSAAPSTPSAPHDDDEGATTQRAPAYRAPDSRFLA